jgi:hypothetical protein
MCQSCGCTPCKKCGAPIENGVCKNCGKPAKDCTCQAKKSRAGGNFGAGERGDLNPGLLFQPSGQ